MRRQRLRSALERKGALPDESAGFLDLRLRMNGGTRVPSVDQALAETAAWLQRIAASPSSGESIVAAPMIKIPKGVILPEALLIIDVVTVTTGVEGRARITVGEVKVFPDRGGHTDPQQLASARAQAGIYRHALQLSVAALGIGDEVDVATDGFLVFTWPGSNSPSIRANEDLVYQAIRAERGFERLEEVAQSIVREDDFAADDPTLVKRVLEAPTDYSEACLSFCDLAPRCHARAVSVDDPIVLGGEVKRLLGDTTVARAVELLTAPNLPTSASRTCSGRWLADELSPRGHAEAPRMGSRPTPAALRHDPPRHDAARAGAARRVRAHGRRVSPMGDRLGHGRRRADDPSRFPTAACATTSPYSPRVSRRTCSSTCACTTGRSTPPQRSRSQASFGRSGSRMVSTSRCCIS